MDHQSLKYFLNHRATTLFQQKWVSKLLGFDYKIQYKHGADNVVADALSRSPGSNLLSEDTLQGPEYTSITYPYFGWLDDLRRHLEQDP